MGVHKVFWEDPYQTELDTTVTAAVGDRITVRDTIAYAYSGGQESDAGTIGGYEILKAEKEEASQEIWYTLPDTHRLQAGDAVHMTIDWRRRYRLMRLHFAAELVLECMYQYFGHPEKIGAHISEEKARVDFFWDGNISAVFPELEVKLADLIRQNAPIVSAFSDEALQRRYWEIEGFARVPCGGTHIKRTGEVGRLALKRKNIGGGKERIEIMLAED